MPGEGTEVQVSVGTEADLEALTERYNHYARETAVTCDTTAFTARAAPPLTALSP